MSLTNKGLVEYCEKVLRLGNDTIYVYGTFGQELTQSLINFKAEQYLYNLPRKRIYRRALLSSGTEYAFDCVGLIKSYIWGGYGKVKYNGKQDKSANDMLNVAKEKGKIKTMPEIPGLLVQMNGHIGVYVGKGYVIECTPNKKFAKQDHGGGGVCKTKLSARKWTHWCKCPYIEYTSTSVHIKPKEEHKKAYNGTLPQLPARGYFYYDTKHNKVKDKGEQVKLLQKFLNWCIDSKLKVDGSLGPATYNAILKFQKTYGLAQDGLFGPKCLKKANSLI